MPIAGSSTPHCFRNALLAASLAMWHPPRTDLVARLQKLIDQPDKLGQAIASLKVHMKNFLKTLNSDFITGDFDKYLKTMSVSGVWGGEIEITALCSLLDCDLNVNNKTGNTMLLFKPDAELATFTAENRVVLQLLFDNNSYYSFIFTEAKIPKERRESFYELAGTSVILDSFLQKNQMKLKQLIKKILNLA